MKKYILTTGIILFLIVELVACSSLPDVPTTEEVSQDVEKLTANIFIGKVEGKDDQWTIANPIIEEMDITWVKEKNTLEAEITAFIGDENWKSEDKKTIAVHYQLNESKQWEAQGVNVNNPVIRVIARK